jgi:hypothetical protein
MVSLLVLPASALAGDWQRAHMPGLRFSISMPGAPDFGKETRKTMVGAVKINKMTVTDGDSLFSVVSSDMPGFVVNYVGEKKIYKQARGGQLQHFYGKKEKWGWTKRAGYKARMLKFSIPDRAGKPARWGRSEIYYYEGRLIVITAVTPLGPAGEAARDRFFNSIRVNAAAVLHAD